MRTIQWGLNPLVEGILLLEASHYLCGVFMKNYRPKMNAYLARRRDQDMECDFTHFFMAIGEEVRNLAIHCGVFKQLNEVDDDRLRRGLDPLSIWVVYKRHPKRVPGGNEALMRRWNLGKPGETAAETRTRLRRAARVRLAA
jgi:hypothetical protein